MTAPRLGLAPPTGGVFRGNQRGFETRRDNTREVSWRAFVNSRLMDCRQVVRVLGCWLLAVWCATLALAKSTGSSDRQAQELIRGLKLRSK